MPGVLEGVAVHAAGKPHPRRDPPRAALGRAGAVRRHGARLRASPGSSTSARRRLPKDLADAASPPLRVPAQQVVFRRALRLPVRPAGQAPRPLPVEEATAG